MHKNEFSILNAMLFDGTGTKPYMADVSVKDGKIESVSPAGNAAATGTVIDANGSALAPGFIDVHSHSDGSILRYPFGDSKISQGVTTEVIGNCGFTEFRQTGGSNVDMDAYADLYREAAPSVNIAALIGHGTLRMEVMKTENRPATAAEKMKMRDMLAAA